MLSVTVDGITAVASTLATPAAAAAAAIAVIVPIRLKRRTARLSSSSSSSCDDQTASAVPPISGTNSKIINSNSPILKPNILTHTQI